MILQAMQTATDTGIHLTLGGSLTALIAKMLYDEFRRSHNNVGGKDILNELSKQTEILQRMSQDIAIVLDRTRGK